MREPSIAEKIVILIFLSVFNVCYLVYLCFFAAVFTESPAMVKKLSDRGVILTQDGQGVRCTVPRSWIRLQKSAQMSEKSREAFRRVREAKKNAVSQQGI